MKFTQLQAVLVATEVTGLSRAPVGVRQRRAGRAPLPRALGGGVGAANPHFVASRSGEQQRVPAGAPWRVALCDETETLLSRRPMTTPKVGSLQQYKLTTVSALLTGFVKLYTQRPH